MTDASPKLTFKPVTGSTWPDLETLFEARGGPSYCWCMPFRPLDVKNRAASSNADRKRGLKAMVRKRTPVGLIGYLKGEPIAWCSVGPRGSFMDKLTDNYDPEEKGVWSVTCFFVRRDRRGEALTQQMLDAALAYAKKRGAKVLEGYPVPATSPSYRLMGFLPLFRGRKVPGGREGRVPPSRYAASGLDGWLPIAYLLRRKGAEDSMFVYIAHAEADKAAAEDLQAFLKTRGLVVNLEDGSRGFHHLQASDVLIALWSQKSVFSVHRLQMEKRMLDAWADERLVLVKLDHGFLPVGMRDLLSIDASFEAGRKLSVWPAVERAAKEAREKGLAARAAPPPPSPAADSFGSAPGGSGGIDPLDDLLRTRAAPPPQAARSKGAAERKMAPPAKRGAPLGAILLVLVIIAAGLWVFTLLPNYTATSPADAPSATLDPSTGLPHQSHHGSTASAWPLLAAAGVGALAFFALVGLLLSRGGKKKAVAPAPKSAVREQARSAEEIFADAAAPAPAPAPPADEPAPTALFISYSHADNAQVEPVVKAVQENGRVVWIDKTGIQTGDGWAGEIVRAIKGARAIIVMCSKHAFESDHVKREVYLADRYKKPLSPVFIEEATPPEDFEYFFASVQWLELWKLPEADRPAAIGKALEAV